jgi:hypothetical protein
MKGNFESNPEFVEGYWFPDNSEFRFIYVDDTVVSSDAGQSPSFSTTELPIRLALKRFSR